MSVTINSVNCSYDWKYTSLCPECPICFHALQLQCNVCIDKHCKCTAVIGECNHAYHLHCISEWLNKHNTCPFDKTTWRYQIDGNTEVCKPVKKIKKMSKSPVRSRSNSPPSIQSRSYTPSPYNSESDSDY